MSDFLDHHFRTTVARDVAGMLVGEEIDAGQFRTVFGYAPDANKVIKIEDEAGSFCNIHEHAVWKAVQFTHFSRWFAPVFQISDCGTALVQARTKPIRSEAELPAKVPAFFTDLKPRNWGHYRGRVVCHDYGNHLLLEHGMTRRMRNANWA